MSLTHSAVAGTNLVTIAVSGELQAQEVAEARKAVEAVVAEHGSVRLLLEYGSSERIKSTGLLDDMRKSDAARKIDRAAVVTDAQWLSTLVATMGHFAPFQVKAFKAEQHGKALEWVTT
jgi:hypothetical protein